MIFMQKKSLFILLFGLTGLAMAEPLTLQEALDRAKQNNPHLKAIKAEEDKASSEKTIARSRFLPQLTLSGRMTHIDEPITIDLTPVRSAILGSNYASTYTSVYSVTQNSLGAATANTMAQTAAASGQTALASQMSEDKFTIKVQDDLFFNATASLVWPIFTGGKIFSAYKAADENVEVQKAISNAEENNVLMEVCTRYFSLRLAEELVALREQTEKSLNEHVDQAKKLEEGGQISKAERLRAEVGLAEAENDLEDARRDCSLARLALANTLGSADTAIDAVTPIQEVKANGSLESYKQRAIENHPGIRQLRLQKKRTENAVTVARGDYFPTIALFGQKELYTKDLTILQPEWAVGVNVEWNLFHGGETAGAVAGAKATQREVECMEDKATQDVSLLVEDRWREMGHAQSRIESLEKTQELTQEALDNQTKAFNAGMATSLDVVDAQLSDSRLKVAMLKAKYESMMALAGLLATSGEVSQIPNELEK